jgi:hypothetical protein
VTTQVTGVQTCALPIYVDVSSELRTDDIRISGNIILDNSTVLFDKTSGTLTSTSIISDSLVGPLTAPTASIGNVVIENSVISSTPVDPLLPPFLNIGTEENEGISFRVFGETSLQGLTEGPSQASFFLNIESSKGTLDTPQALISGDYIGGLRFAGWDGTEFITKGFIFTGIDDASQENPLPGRIDFALNDATGSEEYSISASITARGIVEANAFVAKAFADTAARDATLTDSTQPTPAPGTIVFVTDIGGGTPKFQGWTGSAWVDLH